MKRRTLFGFVIPVLFLLFASPVMAENVLKIGNKTYKPEMVMYDDQYTGQGGTTAATRLVKLDGVKFIMSKFVHAIYRFAALLRFPQEKGDCA